MKSWTASLRSGLEMPCPGFGTWQMGENSRDRDAEVRALRHAFDTGFRHFDTAEMYAEGGAEEVLAEALSTKDRDSVFITSKFYPHHARADQMVRACERSLDRLQMEVIDLYLLHWPGSTPFEETLSGVRALLDHGKIRAFGVSNFDMRLMRQTIDAGMADLIDVNQVMYNPARRGIEFDLLPLLHQHRIPCVAYTPIEPWQIEGNADFAALAAEAGLSPVQLAMAWHCTRQVACPIPKSATPAHIDALATATEVTLSEDQLARIDEAFPPPSRAVTLDIF
ncbi:MAG: aldo/keto reductase [Pseudomonadota bacterium]